MSSTNTTEAGRQFPRTPRSAPRARAFLRERLTAWGITGEAVCTAELLLSELVSNAVRHAPVPPGREIGVRLALDDGILRLEVADTDDRRPEPRPAEAHAEDGRGLAIVSALAEGWGWVPRAHGIGKTVWAELKIR
ncbi:ATP-binding protein [Streptomyces sp. NPDC001889]